MANSLRELMPHAKIVLTKEEFARLWRYGQGGLSWDNLGQITSRGWACYFPEKLCVSIQIHKGIVKSEVKSEDDLVSESKEIIESKFWHRQSKPPIDIWGHNSTLDFAGAAALYEDGTIIAVQADRIADGMNPSSIEAYQFLEQFGSIYKSNPPENYVDRQRAQKRPNAHHVVAFNTSPFDEAAVLVLDAQSEGQKALHQGAYRTHLECMSIWRASNDGFEQLETTRTTHKFANQSLGHFETACAALIGAKSIRDKGAIRGLALQNPTKNWMPWFKKYVNNGIHEKFLMAIFKHIPSIKLAFGLPNPDEDEQRIWADFVSNKEQDPNYKLNIACACQEILAEAAIELARKACRLAQSNNLCFGGALSENPLVNRRLAAEFANFHIYPGALEAQSLGQLLQDKGIRTTEYYHGPEYPEVEGFAPLDLDKIASLIREGKKIIWFQGKSGFAALGHRVIINPEGDCGVPEVLIIDQGRTGIGSEINGQIVNPYVVPQTDSMCYNLVSKCGGLARTAPLVRENGGIVELPQDAIREFEKGGFAAIVINNGNLYCDEPSFSWKDKIFWVFKIIVRYIFFGWFFEWLFQN